MSWCQERRLDWIDDWFAEGRPLQRGDISAYFGISHQRASGDIQRFIAMGPKLAYSRTSKAYIPAANYRSIRNSTPERRAVWAVLAP